MSLLLRQDHFSSKGMSIILSKDDGHSPPKTIFDATIRVLEDICVSSESSSFSLCVWGGRGEREHKVGDVVCDRHHCVSIVASGGHEGTCTLW